MIERVQAQNLKPTIVSDDEGRNSFPIWSCSVWGLPCLAHRCALKHERWQANEFSERGFSFRAYESGRYRKTLASA